MAGSRRRASLKRLAIGYLGVVVVLIYMAIVPGPWKLVVFAAGLAALGYLAALYGHDSRDGRDW